MKIDQFDEIAARPLGFVVNLSELDQTIQDRCDWLDRVFIHNPENRTLTINAKYPYEVDLDRCPDLRALVEWTEHISTKEWATRQILGEFIRRVMTIKGWKKKGLVRFQ